ncbi:hypothetical protein ACHAW5_003198 [Stephanodiscus triporus]|uniref:Cysteine synthase n=1 Tax=Stephanodiscus triporus TaxID=2934178 RepID=A0ABD3MG81_9STRA
MVISFCAFCLFVVIVPTNAARTRNKGPEIINDLKLGGLNLDHWVTGYGTGGIFHGGEYIKENSPATRIVLAEPAVANLIGSGIKTERNSGVCPIPSKGIELKLDQEMLEIPAMSKSLAKNKGILTGISGGAAMWVAVETAKNAPEGSVRVAMLADTGERYLSTPLFADIAAEMNEEELEITRSTPSWILEL